MKKICFITAVHGSAYAFLREHMSILRNEYKVYYICNEPDVNNIKVPNDGYKCVDIQRKISVVNDLKALWNLYRCFKAEKFDAVHSVTPKAGMLTAIAAFCARVPVRIHIYTGQVWATRAGIMRCLLKYIDKIPARLNTHLLVDGQSQRQFLINEGVLKEQNSRVLANGSICGVKLKNFIKSEYVKLNEREKFGIKPDDVVYIFLGRLNHDKGIGELYEAFNRMVIECPKAKLVFYGSDEEGYEAKSLNYPNIKRNINFFYPGRTSRPYDALQGGDVFVLPTWREGFGSSVIEAQALALPVITSDAYGVVDASVEGITGLRCKVGDANGLYECMKQYYFDADLRKKHGIEGRKRVEELFAQDLVTQAWVEFYKSLLQQKL
jgi:glycosyltransferase involved in cell wall biosynthesis